MASPESLRSRPQLENRAPDRLLPRGRPLVEGEDLLATRRADLDADLITYIDVSAAAAKAEYEKRAVQLRRIRRTRMAAVVLSLLAVFASATVWYQREYARHYADFVNDVELRDERLKEAIAKCSAGTP